MKEMMKMLHDINVFVHSKEEIDVEVDYVEKKEDELSYNNQ